MKSEDDSLYASRLGEYRRLLLAELLIPLNPTVTELKRTSVTGHSVILAITTKILTCPAANTLRCWNPHTLGYPDFVTNSESTSANKHRANVFSKPFNRHVHR